MSIDQQKVDATQKTVLNVNELNEELHQLEVETFEIEDLADLGQNPAMKSSSCTSTSSTCTSTGSTSC